MSAHSHYFAHALCASTCTNGGCASSETYVSYLCSELEDYYFYHWQYVEAFIYFSHHFLSIPPPCWTNAAHCNRRLSLGTMITEWKVRWYPYQLGMHPPSQTRRRPIYMHVAADNTIQLRVTCIDGLTQWVAVLSCHTLRTGKEVVHFWVENLFDSHTYFTVEEILLTMAIIIHCTWPLAGWSQAVCQATE